MSSTPYPAYYAAWNNDAAMRLQSTSGGAFSALAEPILAQGGVVVGAAYDGDLNIRHEIVENLEDLSRLRGVKYAYSTVGKEIYAGIREALSKKRYVIFTGVPCQAAAIRKMFGDDEHLLIVELVCFGAPSQVLWRKYVDWLEKRAGRKLTLINPRDKAHGWGRKTYYSYHWSDGKVTRKLSLFDPYAQAFYSAIAFRPPCYHCAFKGANSMADITLGDCWGAEKADLDSDASKLGVSCVIVRTGKGAEALSRAHLNIKPVEGAIMEAENYPILHAAQRPVLSDSFSRDLVILDFGSLVRKYHLQKTNWDCILSRVRAFLSPCVGMVRRIYKHG